MKSARLVLELEVKALIMLVVKPVRIFIGIGPWAMPRVALSVRRRVDFIMMVGVVRE
jgi:hypothetical protein